MFSRKPVKIFLIVLIVIILMLSITRLSQNNSNLTNNITNVSNTVLNPLEKVAVNITDFLGNKFGNFFNVSEIAKENEKLKEENSKLKNQITDYNELKAENKELKKMLDFKEKEINFELQGAKIIAKDSESLYQIITIDKGTNDNIKEFMPVISSDGIVGKIVETGKNWSKVMLISDERSSVSAIIQSTRDSGIVKGMIDENGMYEHLKMIYIDEKSDVKVGDTVISSGLGGIFPKGVMIGKITEVGKDKITNFKYALIEPSTNLQKLEMVFVITNDDFLYNESEIINEQ